MQINITDAPTQTIIFSLIFLAVLLFTSKSTTDKTFLPRPLTDELKGFAIFAVIFSHIGYFLVADHRFLFPLSIFAGAGVNLFLFLSGYGLAQSSARDRLSIWDFYKKRLLKLFTPFWTILGGFLILDYLVLQRTYPLETLIKSSLGFFPRADLFTDINSPLWYFTIIFFYYLIFPILFQKPWRVFSPLLMIVLVLSLLKIPADIHPDVLKLYHLHFIAFPLGVFLSLVKSNSKTDRHYQLFYGIKFFWEKIKWINQKLWQFPLLFLIVLLAYFSINSHVGEKLNTEQTVSILLTLLSVTIFSLKTIQFRLLSLFGIYSYELYLLHWPLMSRYDLFYKYFPPFLATILYLLLFLGLGFLLQKATNLIFKLLSKQAFKS